MYLYNIAPLLSKLSYIISKNLGEQRNRPCLSSHYEEIINLGSLNSTTNVRSSLGSLKRKSQRHVNLFPFEKKIRSNG